MTTLVMNCTLCERSFEEGELVEAMCAGCRSSAGLVPPQPFLRPRIPCARCSSGSFVRVRALREHASSGREHTSHFMRALGVTYDFSEYRTLFRSRDVKYVERDRPVGVLEAYVCRGCGFVELYARDADAIPIGPEHGTDLFEIEGESAYR